VHVFEIRIAGRIDAVWGEITKRGKVRVRLVHDQFESETKTYKSVKGGWEGILRNLKLWVETGDIATWTKVQYALARPFMRFLPKECREG